MTRLFNFIRTQEKKRDEVFVSWNEWERGIYSSGGGNMNEKPFNEG